MGSDGVLLLGISLGVAVPASGGEVPIGNGVCFESGEGVGLNIGIDVGSHL